MAFRDLPDEYMYRQAILRFCHGCIDKDAGESVANTRPAKMEKAVDQVKWAIHTRSAVYGRTTRREVKQLTCEDQDPYVCSVTATKPQQNGELGKNKPTVEHRMSFGGERC